MRKFCLFLVISCLTYQHSTAQCLLPQGKGDTLTPVTNNYYYDSSVNRGKSVVYTVARTGNQYYVSGNFTNIGPNMGSGVVVDSGSKAVLSSKAWKFNGFVRTSIPDGHGGFYVGGDFTQIGDSVRNHLAQIDAAGRPTPWSPNVNGNVYTLLKKNDTLFLGGQFHKVNSQQRIIFAAMSLSGDSLLPYKLGFVDTVDNEGIVYSIKQFGANKLFLAGGLQYSLHSNIEEYDLTGNGSITDWQPQFPIYGTVYSVDISQDGKTVYSAEGSFGYVRANDVLSGDQHFAVQLTNGLGFDNQGVSHSVKVVGNTLYIAGSFNGVNGVPRHGLCAVDASTGQLRNFDLNLNTNYAEYVDLIQGNLVVSGPFTMTGSLEREHFLMVDTSDAHIIASWNPSPSDVVFTVSGSGGKLFLGGYFNGLQSIHRNQLAGFDATTGAILPFAPPADNTGGGIALGQKMVIVGDTLFLFGRTDPSINLPPLKIKLYQLSTGLPIAVDGDLNFTSLNDFLIGGNFLYAAVDNGVRRFNLPGLHLDATWKADFSSLLGAPAAHVLCQDANTIYAVGAANTAFVSKIDKGDASKSTLWTYYDTVKKTNSVAQFGQAVLGDSILFVSGEFNSLNGKIANGMGAINVKTGETLNWSPPFIPNLPPIVRQPGNYVRKLFLNNSALWTGFNFDLSSGAPADIPFAFGALDSISGAYLPTSVSLTGRDDGGGFMSDPYDNGTNLVTAANDFLFDSDYCIIVGKFDKANGEIHGNIVRLSYGSYTPPAGLPAISGPDTVTTSSDSVAFSLPGSLSYNWSYSGSDTRIIDTSADPALLSFGANASSGLLTARSTGYCNSGRYTAQKIVHVVHLPAQPTISSCCLTFSNIHSDRVSLQVTAGNGSGRLIIASTSRPPAQPIKAKTYLADPRFGLGQDLGGGNFPVYSGSGDSLTVTGLQPSTTYYFTVYEYNGAADTINYLISAFAFGNTTTLPAEPTLPPSDISFSNISTTSFTITCMPGNGFARLYLLKAIDTVQASPVDGNQYLADTRFQYGYGFADSSYVVGSFGNQITVSNLKPGTLYQIKLFEYNGGGFTQNYLQSAYATGSVKTLSLAVPPDTATAIPTVAASNIHFDNITTNSVQVSCVAGNGTSRLFVIHPSDTITNLPVNGQTYTPNTIFGKGSDLGNGTYAVGTNGISVTITGLTSGTLYWVAVFEAMGAGSKSSFLIHPFPSQSFMTMTPGSTAINWQDSGFAVTVYPNPVQQSCHLRIISNEAGNLAVKVLSATGKSVRSYNYNIAPGPNDIQLKDFVGLAKGIYLIYWNIQGHQGLEKVYKE